ncbi:putative cytochrome c-554 [Thermogutta terrifontis]|uniref:Putative cytochrome c-554 n=1 Tax=Thermogutta terrifontis TaxID=1331910 RepID=A0A286RI68_9BACT|nr:multiheme c-type cytochrome [Thermogutta terrifontis]ASV75664.1 putative cytochrome c-554 [Thermogutta terrifontis]
MSRSGYRGTAAVTVCTISFFAGMVAAIELGCERSPPPQPIPRKSAASGLATPPPEESPSAVAGTAAVPGKAAVPPTPAPRSESPASSSAASWVKQPETLSAGAPSAVPSGWIIPDEQPAHAVAQAGERSEAPASQAAPPPATFVPAVPTMNVQGELPKQAERGLPKAVVSEAAPGEALPNPLRGGGRPKGQLPSSPIETSSASSPPPLQPAAVIPAAQSQTPAGSSSGFKRRLERPPFDPIKENGQFFVGWTKPQVALVFTGRQDGYFEPCGCAGKERMKGGLSRRHTMIRQLREQGWPLVVMDVGGLIKGFGKQTEVKFQVTVDALRVIGYEAINLGHNDLRLPAPLLLSVVAPVGQQQSEFVSANVALFDFSADQWMSRYRVVEAGGKRVGITAVLGKSYQQEIRNPDLAFMDPEEALAKIVPQLKSQADILVLLADAADEEAFTLVKKFPEFNVLATTDGPAEPPGSPRFVPDTKTLLVRVGEKGMAAAVLGFYDNPDQPVAYQRVILDSRYPDSPEMKQMMVTYQNQLETLGLAGLEIRPVPHPRREIQGDYVGSEKCANCHEKSYLIWKKSGHAKAWDTLKNLDPPRTFDPECISCHVTGWHPTRYFPYISGFLSERETPQLIDVGCESCHGPGGEHVAAEMGSDIERQRRAAQAMIVTKEEAENSEVHNCRNCHDLDNSPDFDFAKYWPLVEHYEKE